MMERETSSRRFPEIGLNEPHHSTTHNPDVTARLENITMINTYQVSLFAHFLKKLASRRRTATARCSITPSSSTVRV